MAEKTNLTKLIHSLILKINDPKEVVRQEIENLFVMLSYVNPHIFDPLDIVAYEDKISYHEPASPFQNIQN
jgi:hypothetical protein